MKKIIVLLITLLFIVSCSKQEENNPLIGTWELVEQYADPGDGSGTFMPITSDKTITFFTDNKISSNGSLCDISIAPTTAGSEGSYSLKDGIITPSSCDLHNNTVNFTHEDSFVTLSFACIEGCGQRFKKID